MEKIVITRRCTQIFCSALGHQFIRREFFKIIMGFWFPCDIFPFSRCALTSATDEGNVIEPLSSRNTWGAYWMENRKEELNVRI